MLIAPPQYGSECPMAMWQCEVDSTLLCPLVVRQCIVRIPLAIALCTVAAYCTSSTAHWPKALW